MIKGKSSQELSKFIGLAEVQVKAVNPTRKQINEILEIDDKEDDKEVEYLSEDQDGNKRVRLSFWLREVKTGRYFVQNIFILDKESVSKAGNKQYVNSTCDTFFCDSEENLPLWFTHFTVKDDETNDYKVIGKKDYRLALVGESELCSLLKVWLGNIRSWRDPSTYVSVDVKRLLRSDFSELREIIGSGYDTSFTVLLGVRTDTDDPTKQYQEIYKRMYLPKGFLTYIEKGKFPNDYNKNLWKKFEEEVTGERGFRAHFELVPMKRYDPSEDPALQGSQVQNIETDSKY